MTQFRKSIKVREDRVGKEDWGKKNTILIILQHKVIYSSCLGLMWHCCSSHVCQEATNTTISSGAETLDKSRWEENTTKWALGKLYCINEFLWHYRKLNHYQWTRRRINHLLFNTVDNYWQLSTTIDNYEQLYFQCTSVQLYIIHSFEIKFNDIRRFSIVFNSS